MHQPQLLALYLAQQEHLHIQLHATHWQRCKRDKEKKHIGYTYDIIGVKN